MIQRLIRWLHLALRWLVQGSDHQYMSKSWLEDDYTLRQHDKYTQQQRHQGDVVAVTRAKDKHVAFWEMVAEKQKRRPLPDNVRRMRTR